MDSSGESAVGFVVSNELDRDNTSGICTERTNAWTIRAARRVDFVAAHVGGQKALRKAVAARPSSFHVAGKGLAGSLHRSQHHPDSRGWVHNPPLIRCGVRGSELR